jgi:hypothetical protein
MYVFHTFVWVCCMRKSAYVIQKEYDTGSNHNLSLGKELKYQILLHAQLCHNLNPTPVSRP